MAEWGSAVGSAGVQVFPKRYPIVRLLQETMRFFAEESCQKCTPCRIGTRGLSFALHELEADLTALAGEQLEEWLHTMERGSICGLGRGSAGAAAGRNAPLAGGVRGARASVPAVFERIVCGVDGSPAGFDALSQALVLRTPQGELFALTAANIGQAAQAGFEASRAAHQLEEEADEARSKAAEVIGDVANSIAEIVRGRPVPVLLAEIERRQADLLAVGRTGRADPLRLCSGASRASCCTEHRVPFCCRPGNRRRVAPTQNRSGHRRLALVARRSGGCSHPPPLDQAELAADLLERGQRALDVLRLDRRGHLHAHPRRALRHDRVAESGDEDALLQQPLAESGSRTRSRRR